MVGRYGIMDPEKLEKTGEDVGNDAQGTVASPCVGVCRLDPRSGFCLGCQRSLDEISSWSRISPNEQRRVVAAAARRRAGLLP